MNNLNIAGRLLRFSGRGLQCTIPFLCVVAMVLPTGTLVAAPLNPGATPLIWPHLIRQFQLPKTPNYPQIKKYIQWYQTHPNGFETMMSNATPYLGYIFAQTQREKLPAELALLPCVESTYKPALYSSAGASGLWQIMPGTASGQGMIINQWADSRQDVSAATHAALQYLMYLHHTLDDNWSLAIAAYNSGEGRIKRAVAKQALSGNALNFWQLDLPQETQSYLPKLLAIKEIILHPKQYGIHLPPIPLPPMITSVTVTKQYTLSDLAYFADFPRSQLKVLNPGLLHEMTHPDGPHNIIIPIDHQDTFVQRLNTHEIKQSNNAELIWRLHKVIPNETLSGLAQTYHTSVNNLLQTNHFQTSLIRPGVTLMIPQYQKQPLPKSTNIPTLKPNQVIPGPKQIRHTVVPGNSLEQIAKLYGVKSDQIIYWNRIPRRALLKPGQILQIWQPTQPAHTKTYTVVAGDTLSSIATRSHTSVSQLKKMNNLHSDQIRVKQPLSLPT